MNQPKNSLTTVQADFSLAQALPQAEAMAGHDERPATRADLLNPTVSMRCETCGNSYDKAFQVVIHGQTHVFDCFECAIQKLAPVCEHCGCRIIGHGVEENDQFYCCAHCAHHEGAAQVMDRA